MRWPVWVGACLWLSAPGTASANDASFGGEGSVLVPLQETRVRMESEEIRLELSDAWTVQARYTFVNPTDAAISLQMGFPEARCPEGMNCVGEGGVFRNLETKIDGAVVEQQIGSVPEGHLLSTHFGRVFVYGATFPAKRALTIEHRYTYDRSIGNGEEFISYVTETGKLWNGPIASARFVIAVPVKPWGWTVQAKGLRVVSVEETKKQTELTLEARQWTPEDNVTVVLEYIPDSFATKVGVDGEKCSIPFSVLHEPARPLPERQALEALSSDELAWCRSLVVAHHGGPVPDAHRKAIYGSVGLDADHKLWAVPNASYSEALFSDAERQYVAMVDALIAARRPQADTEAAPEATPAAPPAQQPSGCGSCAVGSPGAAAPWWLMFALALRRFRRAAPRARACARAAATPPTRSAT